MRRRDAFARVPAAAVRLGRDGLSRVWTGAVLLSLAACNLAPRFDPPTIPATSGFKEAVASRGGAADSANGGDAGDPSKAGDAAAAGGAGNARGGVASNAGWRVAQPQEAAASSNWWEVYQDPELDALEARVAVSNQTIIAAAANYRAARALTQEAQAQLLPTLSIDPSATREKTSAALAGIGGSVSSSGTGTVTSTGTVGTGTTGTTGTGTTGTPGTGAGATATSGAGQSTSVGAHNLFAVPLEASYQLDLWGSIRNTVAADRYAAAASAAQLANALLSTQSTLALDYFQLRVADEQRRILDTTVADYRASLALVRTLVDSGIDSEADLATAEAQLDSALASATDVGVARAQYEHAIAVLIGVPPATFSIAYRRFSQRLPIIPVGVPSDLLERRPDIAAAEQQVAESNAQIGVARAAFFPALTLSASGGYESTAVANLFSLPNRVWSVGPSLALSLFDGGAHRAALAQAHAQNDAQVATYRQTVLSAFQSVEDNLSALKILATELDQEHRATQSARRALQLTLVRYRNGVDAYSSVIAAQNAFLMARETELAVQLRQLTASVMLVDDLGGGWSTARLGDTERAALHPPKESGPTVASAVSPAPVASPVSNAHGASTALAVPNPPPLPAGEIQPDDLGDALTDPLAP